MQNNKTSPWLTTRQLAIVAIFSSLWAAVEITIGTVLVMTKLPFRGAILTAIALGILIVVRRMIPRRGTALVMGVIVAVLRLLIGGPKVLAIAPAIVIEGALVEIAFLMIAGGIGVTRFSCSLAGLLSVTYSFVHTILMLGVISGIRKQHFSAVLDYFEGFRFGLYSLWVAVLVLIIAHALLGVGAGLIFWRLTQRVGTSGIISKL
jgi:hypothetical protein